MDFNINCNISVSGDIINCNGTQYRIDEKITPDSLMFWGLLVTYVFLVLFGGLMSGLTLGMLSQDLMNLKILSIEGSAKEKKYAKRLIPLIKNRHILLVTLVLSNAVAVEAMPICLDRITNAVVSIIVSTTAVLIFGEMLPQAIFSKYGLQVGAILSPIVYVMAFLLLPITYPLAKILDCLLGTDRETFFKRSQLKVLVDLHGPQETRPENKDSRLTKEEVMVMQCALDMREKKAKDAMVPLDRVHMLQADWTLDDGIMKQIMNTKHSRLPIYEGEPKNIIGILLVKNFLKLELDLSKTMSVSDLINPQCFRHVSYVSEDVPMYDLLKQFQTGNCHLSVVRSVLLGNTSDHAIDNTGCGRNYSLQQEGEAIGIITLEDVVEQILQVDIWDEMDLYEDVFHKFNKSFSSIKSPVRRQNSITDDEKLSNSKRLHTRGPQAQADDRTPLLQSQYDNKSYHLPKNSFEE